MREDRDLQKDPDGFLCFWDLRRAIFVVLSHLASHCREGEEAGRRGLLKTPTSADLSQCQRRNVQVQRQRNLHVYTRRGGAGDGDW